MKLQGLLRFLHNDVVTEEIARSLGGYGSNGLAEMLRSVKMVPFANWRCGTLASACEAIDGVLDILVTHFDPAPFKGLDWVQYCAGGLALRHVVLQVADAAHGLGCRLPLS